MDIYPKLSYKPISQCELGGLVLIERSSRKIWALIIEHGEELGAVLLSNLPNIFSPPPCYFLGCDATERVLSFGKNWCIKINWDIDSVELNEKLSSNHNGVLVIEGERHLLYVKYFNPNDAKTAYIDLASGKSVESPKNPIAIFSKWSLAVHMGGDRFETLLPFPVVTEM